MNFNHKMRARDTKSNPLTAIFISVFTMFIVSGILLLILALLLYKLEPAASVIKVGIVVIYVIAGLFGGIFLGKIMREQKFLWWLVAGILYFVILFLVSAIVKGGFDMEPSRVFTTLILCGASGMAGGMIS